MSKLQSNYEKLTTKIPKQTKLISIPKERVVERIVNGVPQIVVYKKEGQKGRPRIVPKEFASHKELKQLLGVKIKDMTPEQKRAYNRLASRIDYAKTRQQEISGQTSTQYKEKLGKKIKDMTDKERRTYYRLAKQEERLIKKYKQ
jgi:hypothetical protein